MSKEAEANKEMDAAVKGVEDFLKAATDKASDAKSGANKGDANAAAAAAKAAIDEAKGAWDQYRAVKNVYRKWVGQFDESDAVSEDLESMVFIAFGFALDAQNKADSATLESLRAQNTPASVMDQAKAVAKLRKESRKEFLKAAEDFAKAEDALDMGDDSAAKAKHSKAKQSGFDHVANARQKKKQAEDLEGKPATFHHFVNPDDHMPATQ